MVGQPRGTPPHPYMVHHREPADMGDSMAQVTLPDYSEFLAVEANLKNEEDQWAERAFYRRNADVLLELIYKTESASVLEMGCGTGWIPLANEFCRGYRYIGVDNNSGCLRLAHEKNPNVPFVKADIRFLPQTFTADIVVSFAVLKHFGLHEWDSVFKSVLRRGKYALFTMQIADEDMDDGVEYHHSWITEAHLWQAVKDAGHEIIRHEVWGVCEAGKGEEWLVFTKRSEQ